MSLYPARALERAMKIQEVILRAASGKIRWMQAAEILGISPRSRRSWRSPQKTGRVSREEENHS